MDANPEDPLNWKDTFKYATELVDEGVLTKEEVIKELSVYSLHSAESAYSWLAEKASMRHLSMFEDDDDISVDIFERYTSNYNKFEALDKNDRIRLLGASILALTSMITAHFIVKDDSISIKDTPLILFEVGLFAAGIKLARKINN